MFCRTPVFLTNSFHRHEESQEETEIVDVNQAMPAMVHYTNLQVSSVFSVVMNAYMLCIYLLDSVCFLLAACCVINLCLCPTYCFGVCLFVNLFVFYLDIV